jgi:hypothetical protein
MEQLFARRHITVFACAVIDHVDGANVYLHDGTRLPARLALVMPGIVGVQALLRSAGLTDEFGFVPVDAQYRHQTYPEIYAAGVAARLQLPSAQGLPSTGYLAWAAGRAVAANLAAAIRGTEPTARTLPRLLDLRILDGGDTGLLLASFAGPCRSAWRCPCRAVRRTGPARCWCATCCGSSARAAPTCPDITCPRVLPMPGRRAGRPSRSRSAASPRMILAEEVSPDRV